MSRNVSPTPAADVEKPPLTRSGDLQVYTPEEVWALVRAAESEADGALFLTDRVLAGVSIPRFSALGQPVGQGVQRTFFTRESTVSGMFFDRPKRAWRVDGPAGWETYGWQ